MTQEHHEFNDEYGVYGQTLCRHCIKVITGTSLLVSMKNNNIKKENMVFNLKLHHNVFNNYKSFIIARNYKSPLNYFSPVIELINWVEQNGIDNITKVRQIDLIKYLDHLATRPNKRIAGALSDSSIKTHMFSINLLFEMMLDMKLINKAYFLPAFYRTDKVDRNILSIEEIHEIKTYCRNLMELNIINLAYGCGLRRTEIQNLDIQDVKINQGYLIVRKGKKSKRREISLTKKIVEELQNYIFLYRAQKLGEAQFKQKSLLINNNGERISGGSLNEKLKQIIKRTRNNEIIKKNISLHSLRHSITTHLHEAGVGIEYLRDFLGHTEIDTTQLYMVKRKKKLIL